MSITDALVEAVQNLPDDKQQEVLDFADFLRTRSANSGPPLSRGREVTPKIPLPEGDLSATKALFDEMDAEEENDSPEQILQGRRDWETFRDAINETRAQAGARLLYP